MEANAKRMLFERVGSMADWSPKAASYEWKNHVETEEADG